MRWLPPIGFRANDSALHTRLMLDGCGAVQLGLVPLPTGPNDAAPMDSNGDGVLDAPFVLDDNGGRNLLTQCDVDRDGMNDWQDPDHGGYQFGPNTSESHGS